MLTLPIAISTARRRRLLPKAAVRFISTVCLVREYVYDAWGNLIEKRSGLRKLRTLSYDCESRLVKAETVISGKRASIGTYRYYSLGLRIGKTFEIEDQTEHKNFSGKAGGRVKALLLPHRPDRHTAGNDRH